jgi:2-methylcitrate dehydratase
LPNEYKSLQGGEDKLTRVEELADFVMRASYDSLSEAARDQIKIRILDSLGCAMGALDGEPVKIIRRHIEEFDGAGKCSLIAGGKTAPDRAAFYNGALIRYLDFNDSYLAKYETCHPSDNLAAVLAAAEYAGRNGRDLITAAAVAYQVQCRLSDVAPVRAAGFDHTTQGSFAAAAGVSKALGLNRVQTANALAICGTAYNALRVTRTEKLSHWKGLAYPNMGACCLRTALLAGAGITGPLQVFEGKKGFMDSISGYFEIDWSKEDLESVRRTILKRYNAEIHSQTAIETILELRQQHKIVSEEIQHIEVNIFDVAYNIIGGGDEGDKTVVDTKEQADHSLPYIIAVALLDGQVMPEQYLPERIHQKDVQQLLGRIVVQPSDEYSKRFPDEMPCRITVWLQDGRKLVGENRDYLGFHTKPMSWEAALKKYERLSCPHTSASLRNSIAETVMHLDETDVTSLMQLLKTVQREAIKNDSPVGDMKWRKEA